MKVGILGGGQLGRMLLQAAANYPVETYVLENDEHCPAAHLCHHFTKGSITSYDDVYRFGRQVDALTIEIENVNVEALQALEAEGILVFPKASVLTIIKNKILQKQFYEERQIPTASFVVTQTKKELEAHTGFLPAVHKLGEGGYDGRGVQVLKTAADFEKAFDAPAVLEKFVTVQQEIAQIVAMDRNGRVALYPPVDMVFDNDLNLLDYQISPADLPEQVLWRIEGIAMAAVKALQSPGIFAVEMLVNRTGDVFVNEIAPRVHNSGHHTIEANFSSQFDMLWRIILGYPLGNTTHILPAAIVNILGQAGFVGPAAYEGLNEVLQMESAFVHLYGKTDTKPGRKMGHVTILSRETQELVRKAHQIKQILKVVAQ